MVSYFGRKQSGGGFAFLIVKERGERGREFRVCVKTNSKMQDYSSYEVCMNCYKMVHVK